MNAELDVEQLAIVIHKHYDRLKGCLIEHNIPRSDDYDQDLLNEFINLMRRDGPESLPLRDAAMEFAVNRLLVFFAAHTNPKNTEKWRKQMLGQFKNMLGGQVLREMYLTRLDGLQKLTMSLMVNDDFDASPSPSKQQIDEEKRVQITEKKKKNVRVKFE